MIDRRDDGRTGSNEATAELLAGEGATLRRSGLGCEADELGGCMLRACVVHECCVLLVFATVYST